MLSRITCYCISQFQLTKQISELLHLLNPMPEVSFWAERMPGVGESELMKARNFSLGERVEMHWFADQYGKEAGGKGEANWKVLFTHHPVHDKEFRDTLLSMAIGAMAEEDGFQDYAR